MSRAWWIPAVLACGLLAQQKPPAPDPARPEQAPAEEDEALKPKDVNVHMRLGRLYQSLGKGDEAKKEFEGARGLNTEREGLVSVLSRGSEEETAAPAGPTASHERRCRTAYLK